MNRRQQDQLYSHLPNIGMVKRYLARRQLQKQEGQYLSDEEIRAGETSDAKKKEITDAYFAAYPDRMKSARKDIEKCLELSPACEGRDAQQLRTDILFCLIGYGFSPEEYVSFELMDRSCDERMTFLPNRMHHWMSLTYNDIFDIWVFNNKARTYERFREYYGRDALHVTGEADWAQFEAFLSDHPRFVFKDIYGAKGRGVELMDFSDAGSDPKEWFSSTAAKGSFLVEQVVEQSADLAQFNPSSVNTVRCINFHTRNGEVTPFMILRLGRSGSFVDNAGSGGIVARIDADSGIILTDGSDKLDRRYPVHPDTGVAFRGFQIPEFEQLRRICQEMSASIPSVPYIGWDFAHTDRGWVVIEGNGAAQMSGPQTASKRGTRAETEAILKDMDRQI